MNNLEELLEKEKTYTEEIS